MDEELHRIIELRAYELWQNAGCPDGRALEFWRQAEQEIRADEVDPVLAASSLQPGEFQ